MNFSQNYFDINVNDTIISSDNENSLQGLL